MSQVRLRFPKGKERANRRTSKDSEEAFRGKIATGEVWTNPANGKRYAVYTDPIDAPTNANFDDIHADDSKFSSYVRSKMHHLGQSPASDVVNPKGDVRITRDPLAMKHPEAIYLEMVARQKAMAKAEVQQTVDGTAREVESAPTMLSDESQYNIMLAATQTAATMMATKEDVLENAAARRNYSTVGTEQAILKRHRHVRDKPRHARNILRRQLPAAAQHDDSGVPHRELPEGMVGADLRRRGDAAGSSEVGIDKGIAYRPDADLMNMHAGPSAAQAALPERQDGASYVQRTDGVYVGAPSSTYLPEGRRAMDPVFNGVHKKSTLYKGYVPPTWKGLEGTRGPTQLTVAAAPIALKDTTKVPRAEQRAYRWEHSWGVADAELAPVARKTTATPSAVAVHDGWMYSGTGTQQIATQRLVPQSLAGPGDRIMKDFVGDGPKATTHAPYAVPHMNSGRTDAPVLYAPPRVAHVRNHGYVTQAAVDTTANVMHAPFGSTPIDFAHARNQGYVTQASVDTTANVMHAPFGSTQIDVATDLRQVPLQQPSGGGFLPHSLTEPATRNRSVLPHQTGSASGIGLGQGTFVPREDALPVTAYGRSLHARDVGASVGGRARVGMAYDALGVGDEITQRGAVATSVGYGTAVGLQRGASPVMRERAMTNRRIGGRTTSGTRLASRIKGGCGYESDASGYADE